MRMLRWVSKNKWKDRIQNKEICIKIGIAPSDEKMKENHLTQFDHVLRKVTNTMVIKSRLIQVEKTKKGTR